jgi:hypothetical protein
VKVWALTCDACEDYLRHDPHWAVTSSEIPETHDETKSREDFERRGAKDKDAILTLALARLAGIDAAELPESLTRMISGQPLHVPVQGQLECPSCGAGAPPGQRFCGGCGSPLSVPVSKAAIPGPQSHAQPPAPEPAPSQGFRPKRLRDANRETLQGLARSKGVSDEGKRGDLIVRLSNAGVTNNDLLRFLEHPVAA